MHDATAVEADAGIIQHDVANPMQDGSAWATGGGSGQAGETDSGCAGRQAASPYLNAACRAVVPAAAAAICCCASQCSNLRTLPLAHGPDTQVGASP